MNKNQELSEHPGLSKRSMRNSMESASLHIKEKKEWLKSLWEAKVRAAVVEADEQSSLALQNSLDIFLTELVTSLHQAAEASHLRPEKYGMGKFHGSQRAKVAGYFLPQLLKEFSVLREVLLDNLQDSDLLTFEVGRIINNSIDSSISLAATEFVKVERENLTTALKTAEESNRNLEHFAAIAAHDLKSPLATISGYLDLLVGNESALRKDSIGYIDVMQSAASRMSSLIDRMLDFARISKSERPFQTIDVKKLIQSVFQNLNQEIVKSQVQIRTGTLQSVKGDPDLLIQLFQNLIANSLKFRSRSSPIIEITSVFDGGKIQYSLKDNGIGFDPKDKENIFLLFKKLRGEDQYRGAGIGLATCRKVVELHGGQIWAESTPGTGSTFYFTLPCAEMNCTESHH